MDDTLKDDLAAFKLVNDAEKEQRKTMLDVLEFVKLGKQWHQSDMDKRQKEGRPCLVINRLPAFGKQVTNDARQNRPAIMCHPIGDKADRETAEILNGLIRNIEYTSNADVAYDTGLDFAVNCGIGYWTVNIDYACEDSFDKDLRIERVSNPFSIYGDPASTAADSSDWNTAFITDRISEKEFKKRYPGASMANFEADDSRDSDWYEEDMIRIAERWSREKVGVKLLKLSDGSLMMEPEYLKLRDILEVRQVSVTGDRATEMYKVTQRIITGAEILETNNWPGKYIPIIPCYGDEVNIEGKRTFQSLFHFALDPQRNYNYWRTATTELVALAPKTPFIGPAGAFDTDAEKWQTANVDSHPYIQFDGPQMPQRQGFAGPPAGALQEALNASDDLKNIMGLHDASLGAQSNETSGRAIMARQREGDVATFNFIDNQSRAIRHTGRILVDLIPKIYDVARIVRVIKEDGTNYSVPVNQPVMPKPPEDGQQNAPQGQPQFQPIPEELKAKLEGVSKVFDLAAGKYDVTCESGPSFTSRREEASQQMMEFIRVFPQAAPFVGDLMAKNLDWPGSDEIAKRLQSMLPPQSQGEKPPQLMQAEQAINQLKQQLGQATQALQEKQTQDQFKAQELQIKQFEAETKRMAESAKAQPQQETQEQPADHSFEAWSIQFKEEQANLRKKMEIEAAMRLELIKQQQQPILGEELMEPEEEYDPETGELMERPEKPEKVDPIAQLAQMHGELMQHLAKPKTIIRDGSGRAVGVQ